MNVTKDMLSIYCETIRQKYNNIVFITIGKVQKLILTLSNKERYVLHHKNFQLYLDVGLKLKKVH